MGRLARQEKAKRITPCRTSTIFSVATSTARGVKIRAAPSAKAGTVQSLSHQALLNEGAVKVGGPLLDQNSFCAITRSVMSPPRYYGYFLTAKLCHRKSDGVLAHLDILRGRRLRGGQGRWKMFQHLGLVDDANGKLSTGQPDGGKSADRISPA